MEEKNEEKNGLFEVPEGQEIWRSHLRELKSRTGMHTNHIATKANLPEKTVRRVFSGEAKNPGVDIVRRIINALGGSWSEIFAESSAVIATDDYTELQERLAGALEELTDARNALNIATVELAAQKDMMAALRAENQILSVKLEYTEKLVSVHNYYNKLP